MIKDIIGRNNFVSVIIPTLNNLNYLNYAWQFKFSFNHDIIIHVNIGDDGTVEYLKKK